MAPHACGAQNRLVKSGNARDIWLVGRGHSLRPNVPLRVVHADGGVLTGARVVLVGEAVLVVEVPPLGVDQVLRCAAQLAMTRKSLYGSRVTATLPGFSSSKSRAATYPSRSQLLIVWQSMSFPFDVLDDGLA